MATKTHSQETMTMANQQTLDFQHGTHLRDYWKIVLRRKWIVIGFCFLTTTAVGLMSFFTMPLYQASATIVIESESDVLNPSQDSSRGLSYDVFENYIKTQISLILSRSVAGKVFEEMHLGELPRYQREPHPVKRRLNAWWDQFAAIFSTPAPGSGKPDAFNLFLKDMSLQRIQGTRALIISVYNPDAQMAADIANAVAERYARDNLMRRALRFIRNQRMSTLNADYLRLKSHYDTLVNQYGPKHHEVILLKDEIRALAERIEQEQFQNKTLENSVMAGVASDTLPKEEEARLLEDILHKIQETSVLSSSQMSNIAVADPAVPSADYALPQKKQDILFGFFVGLAIGIFLAFFVDYLDDTIKNDEDLKRLIGNETYMGAIPFDARVKGFHKIAKVDKIVLQRPLSGTAEAYRLIRLQLQWLSQKEYGFKDIAVVSSLPDEGKSTIASNLAISFSQLDQRVLLVDTDIRRGRLQRSYETNARMGLGQYLTDGIQFEDVIQSTKIPNLWLVTPGESPIMGSELFSSVRMMEFIQETRKNFDLIIYDTPPIMLISDASVLLAYLYGAILVTRAGVTQGRIIPKAIRMIHNANTKLIGVVLNSNQQEENNKYYHRYYRD